MLDSSESGCDDGTGRVWSLWDMIESEISGFFILLTDLARLRQLYEEFDGLMDQAHLETLGGIFDGLWTLSADAHFKNAANTISTSNKWVKANDCKYAAAQSEITHVIDAIQNEMEAR